jgi:hypothetical protein
LTIINNGIFNLVIENNIACMDFNPSNDRYPEQLINSSFEREIRYLKQLSGYAWCPEVVDYEYASRKIYFKWYNNTCEDTLSTHWKTQLEIIVRDLFYYVRDYFYQKPSERSERGSRRAERACHSPSGART